jgi:type IV pilus assembly protein PilQ
VQHPGAPGARSPHFRGAPIDLDVKDADLHNVLRLIADAGGASIAVADDVKGTITLRLRKVPWDQALDTVIRMEKLHLERDGDVYLITR